MDRIEVGTIEEYPVYYLPGKNVIFCKNTAIPYKAMVQALYGSIECTEFPEKNLTVRKTDNIVTLGCLTTTITNCNQIKHNVSKLNKK